MTFVTPIDSIVQQNLNGLLGIHPSWRRITLGEIARIQNGFAFSSKFFSVHGGVPLIRIRDINAAHTQTNYTGEFDGAFVVRQGDLLVGMDGDFNCTRWKGPDGLLNQRVCRIVLTDSNYDSTFLLYVLQPYLTAINTATSSMTVKHLSSATLQELPLPLAPLNEQRRIREKIEELFSDLDAGVAALQRASANLKRYRASILAAAVTGRLTADWRATHADPEPASKLLDSLLAERRSRWESDQLAKFAAKGKQPPKGWKDKYAEPTLPDLDRLPNLLLPEGWCWSTVDAVAYVTKLAGFEYTKYVRYDERGDLPVIKAENAGKQGFRRTSFSRVQSETVRHLDRSWLRGGEVLMVFVGAGVGQVAIVPQDDEYFLGPNISMIRIQSKLVLPEYCELFLRSLIGHKLTLSFTKAVAQPSLSMGTIRQIPLVVPPVSEQFQIVAEVDTKLSQIEASETAIDHGLRRAARLRQSILKQAFAGKLVPQDPNDESAAALLERLRAERNGDDASTRVRPTKRKGTVAK